MRLRTGKNRRPPIRWRRIVGRRRGVTTIESAFVLTVLLMVLLVLFDLGVAAFQYNTLSAIARRVARTAIVHGSAAPPDQTAWGPSEYVGSAADSSEIAAAAAPLLVTMSSSDVSIDMTWPDGDNAANHRVSVTLQYIHHPIVPFLSLGSALTLQAQSTMRIAH